MKFLQVSKCKRINQFTHLKLVHFIFTKTLLNFSRNCYPKIVNKKDTNLKANIFIDKFCLFCIFSLFCLFCKLRPKMSMSFFFIILYSHVFIKLSKAIQSSSNSSHFVKSQDL